MIFYFSATGNSFHVASRIAAETGDRLVSIPDSLRERRFEYTLEPGENIGIVSPTYFWGLPAVVRDFLKELKLQSTGAHYVYFVATYGLISGQIDSMSHDIMKEKGYPLDARFNVKMPDTWTPVFDLTDDEKVSAINRKADSRISEILRVIKEKGKGGFMKNKAPMLAVRAVYPSYEWMRKTSRLTVEDTCSGCGLCAKKCPVGAIEMKNGRPVWVKDKCSLCLGCLHRCPQFSIQYGKKTKKHGQYTHPDASL